MSELFAAALLLGKTFADAKIVAPVVALKTDEFYALWNAARLAASGPFFDACDFDTRRGNEMTIMGLRFVRLKERTAL